MIFDSAGNLYGTTMGGGATFGKVYELSPNGDGTWSGRFCTPSARARMEKIPSPAWLQTALGTFMARLSFGGVDGGGSVFKLTPAENSSWAESVLHGFGSGTDGKGPFAGAPILDSAGNLYGTTSSDGKFGGGTVFEITP